MAHEFAGALQQAGRIRQGCAVKESHVNVRSEYIDVAERRISQTCNRTAVVQKLPDSVPALSHYLKPLMRDGSQFTCMLFHPRLDAGSRSRAPLNRSNSVLIFAPLFAFEIYFPWHLCPRNELRPDGRNPEIMHTRERSPYPRFPECLFAPGCGPHSAQAPGGIILQ